jgi:hypothetical protein
MKKTSRTLLVVTPYTKRFGIAVFERKELLHFGVKTLPAPRTIDSVRLETARHLKDVISEFSPSVVVIKTQLKEKGERHREIELTVKEVSRSAGIPTQTRSVGSMKGRYLKIRTVYPELSRFDHFQNRSQREYYSPLLSAVAIGFEFHSHKPQESRDR